MSNDRQHMQWYGDTPTEPLEYHLVGRRSVQADRTYYPVFDHEKRTVRLLLRWRGPMTESMERLKLSAEVVRMPGNPESWSVEAIDSKGDGDIYVTIFSGPEAKDRALEYASCKYESLLHPEKGWLVDDDDG